MASGGRWDGAPKVRRWQFATDEGSRVGASLPQRHFRDGQADPAKRAQVRAELAALREAGDALLGRSDEVRRLAAELRAVNETLWDVEDALRVCEREGDFGSRFVELARSVYQRNDERGGFKRRINELLGAPWGDQKQYGPDDATGGGLGGVTT
jgi:hypothetical protein